MSGKPVPSFRFTGMSATMGKGGRAHSLDCSAGDVVVIQDADLKYDPRDLPRLLEKDTFPPFYGLYGRHFEHSVVAGSDGRGPLRHHSHRRAQGHEADETAHHVGADPQAAQAHRLADARGIRRGMDGDRS